MIKFPYGRVFNWQDDFSHWCSAAVFGSLSLENTSLEDWQRHLAINLTAPFLLSQAFAKQADDGARIVNVLDWRALRPGPDHFPYTISKAALAAMTKSIAVTQHPGSSSMA